MTGMKDHFHSGFPALAGIFRLRFASHSRSKVSAQDDNFWVMTVLS
jgi:hypothetical protein